MTRFMPLAGMVNTTPDHLFLPTQVKDDQVHTMPDHLFLPTQVKDDQVHSVGWYGEYHA